jgi:hypothetical protein
MMKQYKYPSSGKQSTEKRFATKAHNNSFGSYKAGHGRQITRITGKDGKKAI